MGTALREFNELAGKHSIKRWSSEARRDLVVAMVSGDQDARERLISGSLGYVAVHVRLFRHLEDGAIEDLLGVGSLALVEATDSYDISTGFAYSTHAYWHIKHALLGSFPSTPSVHVSRRDYFDLQRRGELPRALSIDGPVPGKEEEGIVLADVLPSDEQSALETLVQEDPNDNPLKRIVAALYTRHFSYNERTIVMLSYGLHGDAPLTQEEIGKMLPKPIGKAAVSYSRGRAILKLKEYFGLTPTPILEEAA